MKTKEEILEQLYITPQDLKILIPELGINNCIKVIKQMREEMEKRNMFVPNSRPLLAQTKLVIKKMGIWKEWGRMNKIIDYFFDSKEQLEEHIKAWKLIGIVVVVSLVASSFIA